MNERIRELVEKSGLYIAYDNKDVTDKELSYFAEMIVAECIGICISNALDDLDSNDGRGSSAKSAFEIKQHFGVES